MDLIFEFIFELLLDGSIEICKCSSVPKFIRYPLIVFISLFFVFIIGIVFFAGILVIAENLFAGLFIFFIGFFMLFSCVFKFRRFYLDRVCRRNV